MINICDNLPIIFGIHENVVADLGYLVERLEFESPDDQLPDSCELKGVILFPIHGTEVLHTHPLKKLQTVTPGHESPLTS